VALTFSGHTPRVASSAPFFNANGLCPHERHATRLSMARCEAVPN
jgi:hypothetical protein